MKILKLQSENIKKLKAVEITPTGDLVVIAGKNDAGKSSVLDSIAMALGGAALIPGQPVRKGTKGGKVTVDLGDFTVTRTFTAAGGGALVVENRDGARYRSPQAMLDKILGALTFDPLAFEREDPKTQTEILRRLVGLNLDDLDKSRTDLYDERTLKNREVKTLEVSVDSHVAYPDAPATEVSVAGLVQQLATAEEYQRLQDEAERAVDRASSAVQALATKGDRLRDEIRKLQEQWKVKEAELEQNTKDHADAVRDVEAKEITAQAAAAVVPDTADLRTQLQAAEDLNIKVRANQQRAAAEKMLEAAKAESAELTRKIFAVDAERSARIGKAAFPVPGLGIGEDGTIQFDGLPFDQASTSARLRVSVAIGLAMNPTLRVLLVRDGSLLDSSNLKLLAEMAAAADAQVWLESMQEEQGDAQVFIVDGEVQTPSNGKGGK